MNHVHRILNIEFLIHSNLMLPKVTAVFFGTRIAAPLLWGWLADVTGRRVLITQVAALLTVVSFFGLLIRTDYLSIMVLTGFYSAFWTASLPQFESITLNALSGREQHYGRIRLWGSVGFVVVALAVGVGREFYGPSIIPIAALVMLIGIWLFTLTVSETPRPASVIGGPGFRKLLTQPGVISLLVVCFLLQMAHSPYYVFLSIELESSGYSETTVSLLWNLGVVAEILLFLSMGWLLPRFGAVRLMAATVVLSALRWAMLAFTVDWLWWLIIAQILHLATFGLYHATAIQLINVSFHGRTQGRGQALYSAISFGLGGSVGAWLSGYGYEWGGASLVFGGAAAVSLLALAFLPAMSRLSQK